jgi:hypothetical protein
METATYRKQKRSADHITFTLRVSVQKYICVFCEVAGMQRDTSRLATVHREEMRQGTRHTGVDPERGAQGTRPPPTNLY